MIYALVIGVLLVVLGGLNVVFAFLPAPAAVEPFLGAMGRRIRFIVSFFPEQRQEFMGRLLTGTLLVFGGAVLVLTAVTRLFLS
jgi:hypothetical protein